MDFEFVLPEQHALMNGPEHTAPAMSPSEPMEVEARESICANHIEEQARDTQDISNTASRPLNAHFPHPISDRRIARKPYRSYPSIRRSARRPSLSSCQRAAQDRAETTFVSAMADLDIKEEREGRRDGDRYRGGGNKRRRDGKTLCSERLHDIDSRT
jgi:hypothetical protein